jgi:hypothetical protein
VQWQEHRTLLRVLFPTTIECDHATYEVQFGAVKRPTHRSTTWDAAKFEVCAHRWMDYSERGLGLSLLNESKYGHSCHDGVLGLSLLRAPKHPDPNADLGEQEFSYALVPHEGSWQDANIMAQAELFNTPPIAYVLTPDEQGPLGTSWSPLSIEVAGDGRNGPGIAVAALKPAAAGRGRSDDLHHLGVVEHLAGFQFARQPVELAAVFGEQCTGPENPSRTSAGRSRQVAHTRRTSTRRTAVSPTRRSSPHSSTRSSAACMGVGISATSSRKSVPPCAASMSP